MRALSAVKRMVTRISQEELMREIQHKTKQIREVHEIPDLVEVQRRSYDWFLTEGLRELFRNFSPIYDFTGNLALELLDYVLGEPKYSVEECRDREMTYEAPIKAKVRLTATGREVIESEVYMGDLPLMTERGTFLINGAERVVVSQLTRSPGAYFKDTLDYSGRVLYYATIIPSPGSWVEVETDANDVITVRVAQAKKFPITTLLRALNVFPVACPQSEVIGIGELAGRVPVHGVPDLDTGEILIPAGKRATEEQVRRLEPHSVPPTVEVERDDIPCDTTADIIALFSRPRTLNKPTRDHLRGRRTNEDVLDPKSGKVVLKAYQRITDEVARKIESLKPEEFVVLEINRHIEATIDQDPTHTKEEALIDIYHKIRPGDPATPDSARSLLNSIFFDTRRYDLGTVGRYKMDKKLGLRLPEYVRTITKYDILRIIQYIVAMSEGGSMVNWIDNERHSGLVKEARKALAKHEKTLGKDDAAAAQRQRLHDAYEDFENLRWGSILSEDAISAIRDLLRLLPEGEKYVADAASEQHPERIVRFVTCGVDDIDHLENKRVRSVGELLQDQLRMGFMRMEKVAKERMTSLDPESVIPQVILSVKPISASIKSFFGSSQLSQFMDQTNPLAELTHKRRLSALGPGGLSRQSAKLEVRDVHHSHYGRICPIETPEGPNIGLIGSLATHGRVDDYGFIVSPYRVVKHGKVTEEIRYLPADEEDEEYVAPSTTPVDPETGQITNPMVLVRHKSTYPTVRRELVTYMDVSPMQIMSVATAMIPFLENDDANRALMGSNMQRQAVPLLHNEAPLVKTGVEDKAARDSGMVVPAKRPGVVTKVTSEIITVECQDGRVDEYPLVSLLRSNQATCIKQRPVVKVGQRVRQGQVIADGPCTNEGQLALGQNILVAYMPWSGYNYEDAVILSERLVKDDVYTSIHIEKYETEARDTKLGPEEVTRDIPNLGEDMLKDLDENGIIRVGADVRPEDILVGKVAPKGQGELTAEERLIIAIFGKKAEETRDVSLRVPHGEQGKVVDVKVFSRFKYQCSKCETIFNFSKKPERTICERCDGELMREAGDELPAGVNMLVRCYIAQMRKVMEGDKMAGRHGNKGVISKIVPEEDMPFLPDGTPVDIILNPLGVPGRMNIGQILEAHQGLVARNLGIRFRNPIFQGATEPEILTDLAILSAQMRINILRDYANTDLGLEMEFPEADALPRLVNAALDKASEATTHEELAAAVAELGATHEGMLARVEEKLRTLSAGELELAARALNSAPGVADPDAFQEAWASPDGESEEPDGPDAADSSGESDVSDKSESSDESEQPIPFSDEKPPTDYDYKALIDRIRDNVTKRIAVNEKTGKCVVCDGRTGEPFTQPATVGHIYMMKLVHLVEDKIHARSTGPYSLVTQQPLGGKAQFGGQRFGEMEVWALEAYGAAYALQEILTIKSDDVLGRVRTYEAIVKGDSILEPGIPESFKILVNELQSLCLKVTVEDSRDREIDLKSTEEELAEGEETGRISARRRARAIEWKEESPL